MTRRILAFVLLSSLAAILACRTVNYYQEFSYGYPVATGADATIPHRLGATVSVIGPVTPVNVEDDAGDILFMAGHPGAVTGTMTLDAAVSITGQIPVAFDSGQGPLAITGTVTVSNPPATAPCGASGQTPVVSQVLCDAGSGCHLTEVSYYNSSNIAETCCLWPGTVAPSNFDGGISCVPVAAGGNGVPPASYTMLGTGTFGAAGQNFAAGVIASCVTSNVGDGGGGLTASFTASAANNTIESKCYTP